MLFYCNICCSASWLKFTRNLQQAEACFSPFYHCDEMPDTNNNKKGNTYAFRFQYMAIGSLIWSLWHSTLWWQNVEKEVVHLMTGSESLHAYKIERKCWLRSPPSTLSKYPQRSKFFSLRPHLIMVPLLKDSYQNLSILIFII